MTSKKFGNRI